MSTCVEMSVASNRVAGSKETWRQGQEVDTMQVGRSQFPEGTQRLLCLWLIALSLVKLKVHTFYVCIFLPFLELAMFHFQWAICTYDIKHLSVYFFSNLTIQIFCPYLVGLYYYWVVIYIYSGHKYFIKYIIWNYFFLICDLSSFS